MHTGKSILYIAASILLTCSLVAAAAWILERSETQPPFPSTQPDLAADQSPTLRQTSPPTADPTPSPSAIPVAPTPSPSLTPVVLVGAGDISICGHQGDEMTAALLDELPGVVFTAGDNSNETGTLFRYQTCFEPTWGRHKHRMRPSAGNHEYGVEGAADYFAYFGDAAGEPGKGYYTYRLGEWLIVALNSNCSAVGGCGPSSPQVQWLRQELTTAPANCILSYWHHPRWSSGLAGSSAWLDAFWRTLYEFNADVVISGHDHNYERFAPQDADGGYDALRGIRQFVVGTGGASQRPFLKAFPNSVVRNSGTFGVIKFALYPGRYEWEFIPVEGESFRDYGAARCNPGY